MSRRRAESNIDGIAADWVAREDRGELSTEQRQVLDGWLQEDPRHFGAYARAQAVFLHMNRASALANRFTTTPPKPRLLARRRFLQMAGIAGAACATGFLALRTPERHISTGLGEVLRLPLNNGSAITLNSDSYIVIASEPLRQVIRLLDGEVLFDIASAAAQSLIVDLGQSILTGHAGSSFSASHLAASGIEVLVCSGEIAFAEAVAPEAIVHLRANQLMQMLPGRTLQLRALNAMEMNRRLSWRDGMLSFDGETLADAARQFARYSKVLLIVDDPKVANMRVVGLYASNDPSGFAQAVARSLRLRVEHDGQNIHLRAGSAS